MGHIYTVPMANQTIVADATCVILRAASAIGTRASLLRIIRYYIDQIGTETSDELGVIFGQKASAFGTYTSTTPTPHVIGGAASGISGSTSGAAAGAGTDASAEGAGTVTVLEEHGFNNVTGYEKIWTPGEEPIVTPDTAVIVKIVGTPGTLTGWNAGIVYEELN